MNEKLYELLNIARQSAAVAGEAAADVAYAAGQKGSELLSVAKLNIRIIERKNCVKTKMEEIDALKAEIAELEAALGRAKKPACETCGAEIQEGDAFCRECGDVL